MTFLWKAYYFGNKLCLILELLITTRLLTTP